MALTNAAEGRHGILVVGGGLVGSTLAELLARQGRDVTLVERDREVAAELASQLGDVRVLEGNGTTGVALRAAGIERAELVVAVTQVDEANLVAGLLAASFDGPRLIVRVRDPDHSRSFERLRNRSHVGDTLAVNPTIAAAEKIASLLAVPGARDVCSFLNGELIVAGFRISDRSDFAGLAIHNIDLMFAGTPTLVAAIRRGQDWVIPRGGDEICDGDIAYFAVGRDHLQSVLELLGAKQSDHPHVMIAGGTDVGLELARRLESDDDRTPVAELFYDEQQKRRRHARVTLIEEDAERATSASAALHETLVVHGVATDQTLLEEEGIEEVSTFVAATDDHETNLVAALLAKRLGCQRTFALVDNPAIANLVGDIGIDAPIVPRQLTIDLALSYIRGDRVVSVNTLMQEGMEVFEGEVDAKSPLCGGPIHSVSERLHGAIVIAVHHNGKVFIPRGDFQIAPGDHVVMLATGAHAERVGDFLSASS
jgi:trk system potassium uptake protein TrkA